MSLFFYIYDDSTHLQVLIPCQPLPLPINPHSPCRQQPQTGRCWHKIRQSITKLHIFCLLYIYMWWVGGRVREVWSFEHGWAGLQTNTHTHTHLSLTLGDRSLPYLEQFSLPPHWEVKVTCVHVLRRWFVFCFSVRSLDPYTYPPLSHVVVAHMAGQTKWKKERKAVAIFHLE